MESRQSDARNKIIAPVFKRMGIIDQWGNGLKLVAEEMKEYPNIELRWREVGLSFQVQFAKKGYIANTDKKETVVGNVGNNVGSGVGNNTGDNETMLIKLIQQSPQITAKELAEILNLSKRQCERIIADFKKKGILSREGTNRTGYWVVNKPSSR